jgi:hypothetical protein
MRELQFTWIIMSSGCYGAWGGLTPTFRGYLSVRSSMVKLDNLTFGDGTDK